MIDIRRWFIPDTEPDLSTWQVICRPKSVNQNTCSAQSYLYSSLFNFIFYHRIRIREEKKNQRCTYVCQSVKHFLVDACIYPFNRMAVLKPVHFLLSERSKPPTPRLFPKKDVDSQKKDKDTPKKETPKEVTRRDLSKDLTKKEKTPLKKETPKREKDEQNKQEKALEKKVNKGEFSVCLWVPLFYSRILS